jgi:general secretion pathway protein G
MKRSQTGLTMIELMFAMAILAALVAIALPSYQNYREKARIHEAVTDMAAISMNLKNYQLDNRFFPPTLDTLPMYNPVPNDPWGRPYQYLAIDIDPAPNKGAVRKDKNMNPLNSDFDLYSMGPDGQTALPLTAAKARDDIVRADNGRFIGIAKDH